MVCDSCQSKRSKLCVPDKWNANSDNSNGNGGAVRAGKTNKFLQMKKSASQWIPDKQTCRICKSKILTNMKYCNDCAHKKGMRSDNVFLCYY